MAQMLEFADENTFKIKAYQRAARNIQALQDDINIINETGEIDNIPGVGKAIGGKIEEMLATGTFEAYERLARETPVDLEGLLGIMGIGPKTIRMFYRHLGITNVDKLRQAAEDHRIRRLPRMGVIREENILHAIKRSQQEGLMGRTPLGLALPVAEEIRDTLLDDAKVRTARIVGSIRRRKDTVGDIDIIAATDDPDDVMRSFVTMEKVTDVLAEGTTKSSVIYDGNLQVDLRIVPDESFGSLMQHFTGSKEHNVRLRQLALSKGMKLSEYGLTNMATGKLYPCRTEEDEYSGLGLEFIPPELREDRGEVEASQRGQLPDLVTLADIRGDLHVHSTWSDGRHSIEEMAAAAYALGYEYIAVCDHSPSTVVGGGLSGKQVLQKLEEIDRVNEQYDDFRVLSGTECDIRADGSLDYGSDILSRLDIVVVGVHSGFAQDGHTMTKRIISALNNPYVDILAHPTGRLLGKRPGYELDMHAVLNAAQENNVVLEINASPLRLDLNDIHSRWAKDKGILLSVNTDAHSTKTLSYMRFGIDVARRAWLEAGDVLNTWPLAKLCDRLDI